MTEVRIQCVGLIQQMLGKRDQVVRLPGRCALDDLLNLLAAEYGPDFEEKLLEGGEFGPHVIPVDGLNVSSSGGLETTLKGQGSAEIVVLSPPLMGG